jgi:hypothetical protein
LDRERLVLTQSHSKFKRKSTEKPICVCYKQTLYVGFVYGKSGKTREWNVNRLRCRLLYLGGHYVVVSVLILLTLANKFLQSTMRRHDRTTFCEPEYGRFDTFQREARQRPKYNRRSTSGFCFVRPHDRERRPSRLVRFAEFLSGRGPHYVICIPGSRPIPEDWAEIYGCYNCHAPKTSCRTKLQNQRPSIGHSATGNYQNYGPRLPGQRVRFADEDEVHYLGRKHSYPYSHGAWY